MVGLIRYNTDEDTTSIVHWTPVFYRCADGKEAPAAYCFKKTDDILVSFAKKLAPWQNGAISKSYHNIARDLYSEVVG